MRVAVIASADLFERIHAVRVIAAETSVSAMGVGHWAELETLLEELHPQLLVYAPPLHGEPPNAIEWLQEHTNRLVIVQDEPTTKSDDDTTIDPILRITRPVPPETLVLLARRIGVGSGVQQVSFSPPDFLQMVCSSGGTHSLIISQDGQDVGVIEVREGVVWTAFDALGFGEDAFARLVTGANLKARARTAPKTARTRTIFRDLSELLLDSLRRMDEGELAKAQPMTSAQLEAAFLPPEELAAQIKDLTNQARRLLMQKSYDDATRVLIKLNDLDPNASIVQANLEQLRKLGYPR